MRRPLLCLLGLFLCWSDLGAQTAPDPAAPAPTARAYDDKEFPDWVLKLRRAEILAVGAFPLAYLFAGLGYDYVYYFSNGLPQGNSPWPVGPGTSQWTASAQPDLVQQKNLTLVGISLTLSLLLAGVDWYLGL